MFFYHLVLVSLAFWFPAQIAATCSACKSYNAALKSCQQTGANVTQIGGDMDTSSVHCMCVSSSSYNEMNTCEGCIQTDYETTNVVDAEIMAAWLLACKADDEFGDKQAAACWHSQPTDYMPCVEKTGGSTGGVGSGTVSDEPSSTIGTSLPTSTSGSTGSGDDSLSGGSTSTSIASSLPKSTSGSTAATPSPKAKSAGPLSFSMSVPLSVVLIAFGMAIRL